MHWPLSLTKENNFRNSESSTISDWGLRDQEGTTPRKAPRSFIFLNIFWLCYYSFPTFPPLTPSTQQPHSLRQSPLSSCPWVMHISFLATPLPILFLISSYFVPINLYFLIPASFPPLSPFPRPNCNHPNYLHINHSVSVPLVCLVF